MHPGSVWETSLLSTYNKKRLMSSYYNITYGHSINQGIMISLYILLCLASNQPFVTFTQVMNKTNTLTSIKKMIGIKTLKLEIFF